MYFFCKPAPASSQTRVRLGAVTAYMGEPCGARPLSQSTEPADQADGNPLNSHSRPDPNRRPPPQGLFTRISLSRKH